MTLHRGLESAERHESLVSHFLFLIVEIALTLVDLSLDLSDSHLDVAVKYFDCKTQRAIETSVAGHSEWNL